MKNRQVYKLDVTQEIIEQLREGMETAFVDKTVSSNLAYKPQFVSNNYKEGRKVLSSIESELLTCEEFFISVAFITMSGVTPLLQTLKELEKKNVCGHILTTDYLNFSEPKALQKLAELKNITVKVFMSDEADEGFHTKGYMFKKNGTYRIIVGSSNMTLGALTKNKEWNTKIVSTEQGEYADEILSEFDHLWASQYALDYEEFIDKYTVKYNVIKEQRKIAKQTKVTSLEQYKLKPNSMQVSFISNLKKIREAGEKKALLISATGTGKTYASAFALREEKQEKVLFLVHREQIAKQAIESYKKVFGNTKTFGLLSGNSKDYETDYLFSTMQMMAKKETLERFRKDEFQTIVIDEAHRVGATSYQNIIEYFEPQFWLGMTASPERTDSYDVYEAFDHNIAYEIRLQQALEENLLCPFHYFGITDLQIDGKTIDEETGLKDFNKLTSDDRVKYIIEQIQYYGYSGDRVKGLIFCSSKKEAITLSDKFNEKGYRTVALTGDDNQEKREKSIEQLVSDDEGNQLDYIFTVDIFNEGVDIPEINQVVMLRPTESPIVFVQQLGRGLRKAAGKEYIVILDFIGNYKNNFMIPIALSGDRSYNKDNIRRYVLEGERIIPGSSTVHFDEISKSRIFDAIDTANFSDIKLIKQNYFNLKNKLGHIPSLTDFDKYGEMDVLRIFDNNNLRSYYKFLVKYEEEYKVRLSEDEEKVIEFISKRLANGKRIYELELLNKMMTYNHRLLSVLRESLEDEYGIQINKSTENNVVNVMTNEFSTGSDKVVYSDCVFIQKESENEYKTSKSFEKMLENPDFYEVLKELVEFGISRYNRRYKNHDEDDLVLYEKYSRKDVCRILNWERDNSSTIYGYRIKNNTCPIFVTYKKNDDIANSTKYEDQFVNEQIFSWMTRSKVSIDSAESEAIIESAKTGLKIYLFIKKSDGEGTDFYYMGKVHPVSWMETTIMNDKGESLPIMNFQMKLEHSARSDIYEYFTN